MSSDSESKVVVAASSAEDVVQRKHTIILRWQLIANRNE